jgi:hypothetical protein
LDGTIGKIDPDLAGQPLGQGHLAASDFHQHRSIFPCREDNQLRSGPEAFAFQEKAGRRICFDGIDPPAFAGLETT